MPTFIIDGFRKTEPEASAKEVPDLLRSLSPEELARVPRLAPDRVQELLDAGRLFRDAFENGRRAGAVLRGLFFR